MDGNEQYLLNSLDKLVGHLTRQLYFITDLTNSQKIFRNE